MILNLRNLLSTEYRTWAELKKKFPKILEGAGVPLIITTPLVINKYASTRNIRI